MGLYQSLYAGPVLLCRYENIAQQVRFPRCDNPQCRAYHKRALRESPQCPHCGEDMGAEVIDRECPSVTDKDVQTALEAIGSREDVLLDIHHDWCSEIPDCHHVYIPQFYKDQEPPRNFRLGDEEACIFHSHLDIDGEKGWMARVYAEEIEALKKLYTNVWVDWSFLVYSN